jgi:hypothetical protein
MLLKATRNYEDDYYYYVIFEAITGDHEGQYNLQIYSKRFGNMDFTDWYTDIDIAEGVIMTKSKDAYL